MNAIRPCFVLPIDHELSPESPDVGGETDRGLHVVGSSELESDSLDPAIRSRLRVLVVDDESAVRAVCRVNLELAGLEVTEAENGEEAMTLIESERPDIVLLDVMMPRLDGWQVAARLAAAEATRDLPVVFLSARAAQDDRRHGADVGAVGYVVKPFDPIELAPMLERTLARVARGERDALREEMLEGK
jgi:two-component system phosphate regulon response regulator PhoB